MLEQGVDYEINNDGNVVFTRQYHLKRGYCCKNKCLNCPWTDWKKEAKNKNSKKYK